MIDPRPQNWTGLQILPWTCLTFMSNLNMWFLIDYQDIWNLKIVLKRLCTKLRNHWNRLLDKFIYLENKRPMLILQRPKLEYQKTKYLNLAEAVVDQTFLNGKQIVWHFSWNQLNENYYSFFHTSFHFLDFLYVHIGYSNFIFSVWKSTMKRNYNFSGKINIFSVKSTFLLKSWIHEIFWAWSPFIVLFHAAVIFLSLQFGYT